jgi:glycine cleavage system regulatory protein
MKQSLVITLVGPDQTGLVDTLSGIISKHNANWLESRMSSLAGQFAGILHISVDSENAEALSHAILKVPDLNIVIESAGELPTRDISHKVQIEVVGHDRPGIVQQVSHVIAGMRINVEELETEIISAPMSGDLLFKAQALLGLPSGLETEDVYEKLIAIADDIMVTISEHWKRD